MNLFGLARGSRHELADTVSALVGEPTGGIATKARRRLEPVPADDRTDLVDRGLWDGEGELIKGCCKDTVIPIGSFHSSAIPPRFTERGCLRSALPGRCAVVETEHAAWPIALHCSSDLREIEPSHVTEPLHRDLPFAIGLLV